MATTACPRCGSTDTELDSGSVVRDAETADESMTRRCRRCGERFTVTSKID